MAEKALISPARKRSSDSVSGQHLGERGNGIHCARRLNRVDRFAHGADHGAGRAVGLDEEFGVWPEAEVSAKVDQRLRGPRIPGFACVRDDPDDAHASRIRCGPAHNVEAHRVAALEESIRERAVHERFELLLAIRTHAAGLPAQEGNANGLEVPGGYDAPRGVALAGVGGVFLTDNLHLHWRADARPRQAYGHGDGLDPGKRRKCFQRACVAFSSRAGAFVEAGADPKCQHAIPPRTPAWFPATATGSGETGRSRRAAPSPGQAAPRPARAAAVAPG